MKLTDVPSKIVLPFADSGGKNTIPVPSQIGITAGAASLTDGFPPLTRTPISAGGTPPSGLDMNGILFELSAIIRWANSGAGYPYDSTYATDTNVAGYPKGARILRSDGLGYWLNTVDDNDVDPESSGAAAAGWVPDFTNGVAAVTMTSSNVTLSELEYGKPIVVVSGAMTSDLNLIFPDIAGQWALINNTSGGYSITCKTSSGTGVVAGLVTMLIGDSINIYGSAISSDKLATPIASAATVDLTVAGGNLVHITGTVATSAFTMTSGQQMTLIADAAWPLTYHATTNKIDGGESTTLEAGDRIQVTYDGTTVFTRVIKRDGSALASRSVGQCRLTLSGGNLLLSRYNGKHIVINGSSELIPSAGVTLAPTGLSVSTLYYIYAYMSSGTMTLEASTTGHATDSTTGVEIKSGDATRSLVGMAYPVTGPAFADSATQRFVRSWYNDPGINAENYFTADRSTTSATLTEINSEIRCEYLTWAGEKTEALGVGSFFVAATTITVTTALAIDSTSVVAGGAVSYQATTANYATPYCNSAKRVAAADGYHYVTQLGRVSGTTGTWKGNAATGEKCSVAITTGGNA